jgi:hypothetical protein
MMARAGGPVDETQHQVQLELLDNLGAARRLGAVEQLLHVADHFGERVLVAPLELLVRNVAQSRQDGLRDLGH